MSIHESEISASELARREFKEREKKAWAGLFKGFVKHAKLSRNPVFDHKVHVGVAEGVGTLTLDVNLKPYVPDGKIVDPIQKPGSLELTIKPEQDPSLVVIGSASWVIDPQTQEETAQHRFSSHPVRPDFPDTKVVKVVEKVSNFVNGIIDGTVLLR